MESSFPVCAAAPAWCAQRPGSHSPLLKPLFSLSLPDRVEPAPGRLRTRGFTLVEVLVALLLVAVLTATVAPVIVQQLERRHVPLLVNDLTRIGTGIELLHLNLYPAFPSDVEDLLYRPDGEDVQIDFVTPYPERLRRRWAGPYIGMLSVAEGGDVWQEELLTGFDGRIQSGFYCFDSNLNQEMASCADAAGIWVAIKVQQVRASEFEQANDIVDGEGEDDTVAGAAAPSWERGRLRLTDDGAISPGDQVNWMYYLVVPYDA